ncbi:hypothetical protein Tco_0881873 [Tanacetum coccineum]
MAFIQLGGNSRVDEMILARVSSGFAGEKVWEDIQVVPGFVGRERRLYGKEQIVVLDKPLDEHLMSKHLDTVLMGKKLQEVWMDKWLRNVVWDELIHIEETKMVKIEMFEDKVVKTIVETKDCYMKIDKW